MGLLPSRRRSVPQSATDEPGNVTEATETEPVDPAPRPRLHLPRLLRRRRASDSQPQQPELPELRIRWQHGDTWQHGNTVATRLLHVALVGALISGPVALGWVALSLSAQPSGSAAAVGESAAAERDDDATLAAAAAQRLVLTWLTASATDKAALQAQLVEQLPAALELPERRPAPPTQMWVGAIDQRSPGRFRVVVATVGVGGTAYFVVPVRVEAGVAGALSLPGRTQLPISLDPDSNRLPAMTAMPTDDPAFQTAAGYITAYLTGSAELDRWTAPGTPLTAIAPRACGSVRVDSVETVTTEAPTGRAAVVTTATCQTTGRPSSTTQHGLVLQVRDGRWEVIAEDPALLLDPASTPSAQASASAPPVTTTATPR